MLLRHYLALLSAVATAGAVDVQTFDSDAAAYDLGEDAPRETIEEPDLSGGLIASPGGLSEIAIGTRFPYLFNISIASNRSLEGVENPDGDNFTENNVTHHTVVSLTMGDVPQVEDADLCVAVVFGLRSDLVGDSSSYLCGFIDGECRDQLERAAVWGDDCELSFSTLPDNCTDYFTDSVSVSTSRLSDISRDEPTVILTHTTDAEAEGSNGAGMDYTNAAFQKYPMLVSYEGDVDEIDPNGINFCLEPGVPGDFDSLYETYDMRSAQLNRDRDQARDERRLEEDGAGRLARSSILAIVATVVLSIWLGL